MSNQAIGHKRTILKNLQYPNFMFLQHFLSLSFILGKKLYYQHGSLIYQNFVERFQVLFEFQCSKKISTREGDKRELLS